MLVLILVAGPAAGRRLRRRRARRRRQGAARHHRRRRRHRRAEPGRRGATRSRRISPTGPTAPIEVTVDGADPVSLDPERGRAVRRLRRLGRRRRRRADLGPAPAVGLLHRRRRPRRRRRRSTTTPSQAALVGPRRRRRHAGAGRRGRASPRSGVTTRTPRSGKAVDPAAAARRRRGGVPRRGRRPSSLELSDAPARDRRGRRPARRSTTFANPAMSGPVTLIFDKSRVRLPPRRVRRRAGDGAAATASWCPTVDARAAHRAGRGRHQRQGRAGRRDRRSWSTASRKVVPAKPGVTLRPRRRHRRPSSTWSRSPRASASSRWRPPSTRPTSPPATPGR